MSVPVKWKIDLFLKKFFDHWQPNCYVVPRNVNNITLFELGLTPGQRKEIILGLKSSDYFSGPKQEHDPDKFKKGEIWEFGVASNGVNIYIKLKIGESKGDRIAAKCLSFHKTERMINYPYKENH